MSKAILEFNLPEEDKEFRTALNANKYRAILEDIDNDILRSLVKYETLRVMESLYFFEKLKPKEKQLIIKFITCLREDFYGMLQEKGIDLYE